METQNHFMLRIKTCFLFLLVLSMLTATSAYAQMGDYLRVKKNNNRTIKTYFRNSHINLQHANGQVLDGYLVDIRHDSLFIRTYDIRTYFNQFGVTSVDTLGSYIHPMHYAEIFRINTGYKESWRFVKNGSIFMIGGLGYAALNLINAAYLNESVSDPENARSLAIAGAVVVGGFILNRIYHHRMKTGKKYKIEYVHMDINQQGKGG
jgi:hypothetical protein